MRAMLTRDDDYYVPLATRVQKARRVHADLFVSIHADSFTCPQARGSSVFALSEHGATSAAAQMARAEGERGRPHRRRQPRRRRPGARAHAARSVADRADQRQPEGRPPCAGRHRHDEPLHKSDVEQAGFAVLKAPDIPSILVETAFISNPDEEQRLERSPSAPHSPSRCATGSARTSPGAPPLSRRVTLRARTGPGAPALR
jgi:N-acetylmuramoyl-L-alanine amidase